MASLLAERTTFWYESGGSSPHPDYLDFRYYWKIYLDSQSSAEKKSVIKVDHYVQVSGWTASGYQVAGTSTSYVNNAGKSVSVSSGRTYPVGFTLVGTTYHDVSHDNQGYANFNWRGSTTYGYSTSTTTYPLPKLNLYVTITEFNITNIRLDTATVYWFATGGSTDAVQYSINSGSWVDASSSVFAVRGLNPGVQNSVKIRVKRTDSQLWTESSTKYVTPVDKNRITSNVFSVNCDSSLKVTASNASGNQCDIYIELLNANKTARIGDVIRHDNTIDTTFTVEEIQSLANYLPTANSANFRINVVTVVDGIDAYVDYKDGTYSIVNANPLLNNFTYKDINLDVVALTGNNQTIVKGFSNLEAKISKENKAIGQKGASIVGYRLVVGEKQYPSTGLISYSETENVYLSLDAVDNNVFTVYAIDSRGNSTQKQISPATYIAYTDLSIGNANVGRGDGGVGSDVSLTVNGSFFNANFGAVQNSIKSIKYKYKRTNITNNWIQILEFVFHYVDGHKITFTNQYGDAEDNLHTYFKKGDRIRLVDGYGQNEIITTVGYIEPDGSFLVVIDEIEPNQIYAYYEKLWIDGTTEIPVTENGTSYSIESLIAGDLEALGFNPEFSYDIILTIADELSSRSYSLLLGTGTPSYAVHADGMAINQPFDETQGKSFQVAGKLIQNGIEKIILDFEVVEEWEDV